MDATTRRRWVGGLVLLAAVAMLVCGQTVLSGKLNPSLFVLYWSICFVLTGVAILIAFRDLRALQERIRQQHHDLLQETLQQIQTEARRRAHTPRRESETNGSPNPKERKGRREP